MAIYDFENNSLVKVDQTTFSSEGILERQNLQAALKQQIEIVCPDSMVIAEEFSEWSDSQRRIDLLAIDKDANLVVIELKRNESGEHMELQAIRYAAMVSTLTFKQATDIFQRYLEKNGSEENAEEKLLDFLDWETPKEEEFGLDVRIVLVSANFSKELTTSVMWLMERNVDIKCVRLIPHNYNNKILIDVQQIIPLPEAESYRVKIKEQAEERREARKSSKDYTQYMYNGEVYNKRKLVLAVIQDWFHENKPQRVSELLSVFPQLAISLHEAQEIVEKQGVPRHFLNQEEVLDFPVDGCYAISNQWGKGNIRFFLECARNTGFDIEEVTTKKQRRVGEDIGEIVEERIVNLKNGDEFKIIRRDSNQIQVFEGAEQVMAKGILRRIITENNFDIPMTGTTTQQMGKRVLDRLRGE